VYSGFELHTLSRRDKFSSAHPQQQMGSGHFSSRRDVHIQAQFMSIRIFD